MLLPVSGVRCKALRELRPVLEKWRECNNECVQAWGTDGVPWGHGERASLSVFAGAVWRAGGIAFEEYRDYKMEGDRRYLGRTDLYIKVKRSEFIAETKYVGWHRLPVDADGIVGTVAGWLDAACADVRNCADTSYRRLGIVFVAPGFGRMECRELRPLMEEWIKAVSRVPCSCAAWTFPQQAWTCSYDEKRIIPGTAVLIRETRR